MKLLKKISKSLSDVGLWATMVKVYIFFTDVFFDIKYGTATGTWIELEDLTIKSDNRARGYNYVATRVIPLRKLFNKIKQMIPEESVFVDLGCGKGRALLIASQFGFNEAVGVEFAHELCEIAKKNCDSYKTKTAIETEFQIIESDVVDYTINTKENIFFMFNPFDEVVLDKILDNITSSIREFYRKILIIYCNPQFGNLIEQHEQFIKSGDFRLSGFNFSVYSNEV